MVLFRLFLIIAFAVASVPAWSQALSVDEVLALFYQRNLDVLAAQYQIDQARAEAVIAGAIPNPTLGVQLAELSNNPNRGASALGCDHAPTVSCGPAAIFSISQLIEVAGKRGLRMESGALASEAAESDFRDAVRVLSNGVRAAYFDLLQAQKNRWLAQEIVAHYQVISQANHLRLKNGDIAESDYLRVSMEIQRAESDRDNAQAAVEQAQAALAKWLRWPDSSLQLEAADLWPSLQAIGQQLPLETLISQALAQRPDLQADQQRLAQAEKEQQLAQRLIYPDVTVNAGYARDPSNNALDSFFVGVNVPMPAFYQYQGETDKASVNRSQKQLAVQQTEQAIRTEVVSSLAAWHSADSVVQRFENGLLTSAQTVRTSSELAYRKGATSVLDFIEAQRSYKNVMRDYYAAMINRAHAYYDLVKALGDEKRSPTQPAPQG